MAMGMPLREMETKGLSWVRSFISWIPGEEGAGAVWFVDSVDFIMSDDVFPCKGDVPAGSDLRISHRPAWYWGSPSLPPTVFSFKLNGDRIPIGVTVPSDDLGGCRF